MCVVVAIIVHPCVLGGVEAAAAAGLLFIPRFKFFLRFRRRVDDFGLLWAAETGCEGVMSFNARHAIEEVLSFEHHDAAVPNALHFIAPK